MACPGGYDTTRNEGVAFCTGSCGAGRRLEWQKKRYSYPNGTTCVEDVYVGCC